MLLVELSRDDDHAAGGSALADLACVWGGALGYDHMMRRSFCLQLHYTFYFGGYSVAYVSVAISLLILTRLACT